MIIQYFGQEYYFLSNHFKYLPIYLDGDSYKTVAHAFYASRLSGNNLIGQGYRHQIQIIKNPAGVRTWAEGFQADTTWEQNKISIMESLVRQKFSDKKLAYYLKETHPVELIYGNRLHDNLWGKCRCSRCGFSGRNKLGILLMSIREELVKE